VIHWQNRAVDRARQIVVSVVLAGCSSAATPPDAAVMPLDSAVSIDATAADATTIDATLQTDAATTIGTPITATPATWTWVDFPDSSCGDGSATGLGVNVEPSSTDLVIFLNGGGACWDYVTCFQLHTATSGPFGSNEFGAMTAGGVSGSILDRAVSANPLRAASMVFVPYCTGDMFGGDRVASYADTSGGMHSFAHRGHSNLAAFLPRLAATFPSVTRVVLAGSSSGGFGALFNYETVHAYWPTASVILLDDSGVPLEAPDVPPGYLTAWYANWGLGDLLDGLCPGCRTDLSQSLRGLITRHPTERMALLTSEQDQTMRSYFLLAATQYQTAVLQVATDVLDPSTNARGFYVAGTTHTMLGDPTNFTQGVPLWTWLSQLVTGDPAWTSQRP
jgi:hypothetical protein